MLEEMTLDRHSVLVVHVDDADANAARDLSKRLRAELVSRDMDNLVIVLGGGVKIEQLNDKQMNQHGWFRRARKKYGQ